MRRRVVVLLVLVGVLGAAGCSDDDPVPVATPRSATTTAVPVVGVDGSQVPDEDLDAIAARIESIARTTTLDRATSDLLMRVQLQAIGFTSDQASCVVTSVPDRPDAQGLGPATVMSAIPPEAFAACVDPSTLQMGSAPDMSRVPPSELRSALSGVLSALWTASGLHADEVACMVDAAVSSVEDAELPALLETPEPAASRTREVVGSCLTAARASELAAAAR